MSVCRFKCRAPRLQRIGRYRECDQVCYRRKIVWGGLLAANTMALGMVIIQTQRKRHH